MDVKTGPISRFMSVRGKKDGESSHKRQKSREKSSERKLQSRQIMSENMFSLFKTNPQKKLDKEHKDKMDTVKQRLADLSVYNVPEEQITFALQSHNARGDINKAVELVVMFQEAANLEIRPYDPKVHMLGAVNNGEVTCYLDALLFGMYANLDSFEVILRQPFKDDNRSRLAALLRLWINMLRSGWLIETDITNHLQQAIAACGWEEAISGEQQDTSLFFNWLAETLELPLLTLKSDTYHEGKEDTAFDHKVVHERLLNIAVPDETPDGRPIRLEVCLEAYFNTQVEVDRFKLERSNTMTSGSEKEEAVHVEVVEVPPTPGTPVSPRSTRHRTNSLLYRYTLPDNANKTPIGGPPELETPGSAHRASVSQEAKMPAFQFLSLLPWLPQKPVGYELVSEYLKDNRPTLGVCLKRYGVVNKQVVRINTEVDIPIELRLPHLIEEDVEADPNSPLIRNFTLVLQSVICHRGSDLSSGHYVCFIRGGSEVADGDSRSSRRLSTTSQPPEYPVEQWYKHDDLATPRVKEVRNIVEALKEEMPYLLFYRVKPPTENLSLDPPAYSDSGIDVKIFESSPLSDGRYESGYFDSAMSSVLPTPRRSIELETPRRSINLPEDRADLFTAAQDSDLNAKLNKGVPEDRRGSVTFDEENIESTNISNRTSDIVSAPVTPAEETAAQRLSRAASKFRNVSKSRPTSSSGENRITATLTRLAQRSKEQLVKPERDTTPAPSPGVEVPPAIVTTDGADDLPEVTKATAEPVGSVQEAKKQLNSSAKKLNKGKEVATTGDHQHHHHRHRSKGNKDEKPRDCSIM